jgi:hypothetical protein
MNGRDWTCEPDRSNAKMRPDLKHGGETKLQDRAVEAYPYGRYGKRARRPTADGTDSLLFRVLLRGSHPRDLLEITSEGTIRNLVAIVATVPNFRDAARIDEVLDNAIGTSLRDVETGCNVSESQARVICNTGEHTTAYR